MKQYAGILQEYLIAASFNKSLKILTVAGSKKNGVSLVDAQSKRNTNPSLVGDRL
jgi:hypothetical protein